MLLPPTIVYANPKYTPSVATTNHAPYNMLLSLAVLGTFRQHLAYPALIHGLSCLAFIWSSHSPFSIHTFSSHFANSTSLAGRSSIGKRRTWA